MLKCNPLLEACQKCKKTSQAENLHWGCSAGIHSLLPICILPSPARGQGGNKAQAGQGEGGQTHRQCPPCLLKSVCKKSGTSLRATFQDHSVQRAPSQSKSRLTASLQPPPERAGTRAALPTPT